MKKSFTFVKDVIQIGCFAYTMALALRGWADMFREFRKPRFSNDQLVEK